MQSLSLFVETRNIITISFAIMNTLVTQHNRGTEIPSWKTKLINKVKHYGIIFRVNNSKCFYLANITQSNLR